MKSTVVSVFGNRLITSNSFVSLTKNESEVILTLTNTYYAEQATSSVDHLFDITKGELSVFNTFAFDNNTIINLDAISGAHIAEPTVSNVRYTVYVYLGRTKLYTYKNTHEEALAYLHELVSKINGDKR